MDGGVLHRYTRIYHHRECYWYITTWYVILHRSYWSRCSNVAYCLCTHLYPALGSTWQSRSRGLLNGEHWKGSTHKRRRRSSSGWRLPCEGGIPILPHSSGVANEQRDEHALDRSDINRRSVGQVPV